MYVREQIYSTKCQCGRGLRKSAETATDITNEELCPSILSGRCSTTGRRTSRGLLNDLLYFAIRGEPPWGRCPMPIMMISSVVTHDLIRSFGLR